jgi:hypothetical protein
MNDLGFYKEFKNRALELQQEAAKQRLVRSAQQPQQVFWVSPLKRFLAGRRFKKQTRV